MKKMGKYLGIIAFAAIIGFTLIGCGGGGSGRNFTDVGRVEDWLARQSGGASPDDPISFSVNVNLQNMAARESNWHRLLTSINTAGLYVALDLSGSTMPGTEFNVGGGITAGKPFIVSLVLPDSAQSVSGGIIFTRFRNLRTVRARNIDFFVGERGPGGGIIFYDRGYFADGWRFLEAAPASTPTRLRWSTQTDRRGPFINISGTSEKIGTGRRNTELILAGDPTAPAALASVNYSNNGKTDWFLPSLHELGLMFRNRFIIGGFTNNWYWSSSQHSVNGAWALHLRDGPDLGSSKHYAEFVRPIRAF